jgi:hypothetical protein
MEVARAEVAGLAQFPYSAQPPTLAPRDRYPKCLQASLGPSTTCPCSLGPGSAELGPLAHCLAKLAGGSATLGCGDSFPTRQAISRILKCLALLSPSTAALPAPPVPTSTDEVSNVDVVVQALTVARPSKPML